MLFKDLKIGMRFDVHNEDDHDAFTNCNIIDIHDNGKLVFVHFNDPDGSSTAGYHNQPIHNFLTYRGEK